MKKTARYQLEMAESTYNNSKFVLHEWKKISLKNGMNIRRNLAPNGKNSYPANDAEKEWRASKEAAEKYNMETVYTAKKNVDKYQENYERMESRLKTDNASHDKITNKRNDFC